MVTLQFNLLKVVWQVRVCNKFYTLCRFRICAPHFTGWLSRGATFSEFLKHLKEGFAYNLVILIDYLQPNAEQDHLRMTLAPMINPTPRIAWFVGWLVGWLVTKFQPHHTHMQHSQGLNITDVCIMHICIIIKEHMYMHRAYMIKEHMYMHHVYMHLLESPSLLVPPLPKSFAS